MQTLDSNIYVASYAMCCAGSLQDAEAVRFDSNQVKIGDYVFVHCEPEKTDVRQEYTYALPLSLGKVVRVTTRMEGVGDNRMLKVVALDLVYQMVEQGDSQLYENRWCPWIVSGQRSKNATYKQEGMAIEFIRPIKVEVKRTDVRGKQMKEGQFVLHPTTLGQLCRDKFGETNSEVSVLNILVYLFHSFVFVFPFLTNEAIEVNVLCVSVLAQTFFCGVVICSQVRGVRFREDVVGGSVIP